MIPHFSNSSFRELTRNEYDSLAKCVDFLDELETDNWIQSQFLSQKIAALEKTQFALKEISKIVVQVNLETLRKLRRHGIYLDQDVVEDLRLSFNNLSLK